MNNYLNLNEVKEKEIYNLGDNFSGTNAKGDEISFTNYYMQKNGTPFFGISGEMHFSRVNENDWDNEILKIKMCGINIISTYIFWIHHEEEEGVFRFDGRRNIRKFLELLKKYDMYSIVRIGPFCHGEVRNGGIPDWMYGKPFEVRSLDEGFLFYVKRLYEKTAEEFKGLYFMEGGPIIAAQIDNEYMHSCAPWEITTGISNEWLSVGTDGNEYMLKLKKLAKDSGIITPFYTCTGWGDAKAPTEEMLPLWGGYAFWPWIFYSHKGEHPATPEYIYRDNHNNSVTDTYNFKPDYEPESRPYSCCEMGGGMMCSYNYRFKLPYESIDAMANIKMGSGCNFLGYYMFKGGTNPVGKRTPFLNEGQVAKISYDYQAAIGEFGQLRLSYYRLKALHMFTQSFAEELCVMKSILPEGAEKIKPEDTEKLRYCVRINKNSGFVFINNYQDHVKTKDKRNQSITLDLPSESITIPDISIDADETSILPFNMDVGGYRLIYSRTQPLTYLVVGEKKYYFFFVPKGMKPVYEFDTDKIYSINGKIVDAANRYLTCEVSENSISSLIIKGEFGVVEIITLPREESLNFYKLSIKGQDTAVLCDGALLYDQDKLFMETLKVTNKFLSFPEVKLSKSKVQIGKTGKECNINERTDHVFKGFEIAAPSECVRSIELEYSQVGPTRYTVKIPKDYLKDAKDMLLQINYVGDIGHAFIDGEMISDNFCNGEVWDIGLKEFEEVLKVHPITIYITPIKKDAKVNVDSSMAARLEEVSGIIGKLLNVGLQPVCEITLTMQDIVK